MPTTTKPKDSSQKPNSEKSVKNKKSPTTPKPKDSPRKPIPQKPVRNNVIVTMKQDNYPEYNASNAKAILKKMKGMILEKDKQLKNVLDEYYAAKPDLRRFDRKIAFMDMKMYMLWQEFKCLTTLKARKMEVLSIFAMDFDEIEEIRPTFHPVVWRWIDSALYTWNRKIERTKWMKLFVAKEEELREEEKSVQLKMEVLAQKEQELEDINLVLKFMEDHPNLSETELRDRIYDLLDFHPSEPEDCPPPATFLSSGSSQSSWTDDDMESDEEIQLDF